MTPGQPGSKFCGACGSAFDARPVSPGDPPVGSLLADRYEMGLALGETPYGRAYIAWDRADAATRVLVASHGAQAFASELANPVDAEESARFFAGRSLTSGPSVEGAATASELLAEGDRLITVFDEGPGRAMVNADTLLDALESRDRPPQAQETVGFFGGVAGALEGIHALGRVHGRVSPHTVFVGAGAPAMLLDVPAIQAGGDPRAASLLDEPYAAPELIEGQAGSPASDVYALAATIYRVLTARTPAGRSKHEIAGDAQHAGATAAAAEVLAQALADNPSERFAAVKPFWNAFQASFVKPPAPAWPKIAAMIVLLLGVVAGGVYIGLEYGPGWLAMLQGGPEIVLVGPEEPVAMGGDAELRWEAPADATVTLDGIAVGSAGATTISGVSADRQFVLTATLADGSVQTRTFDLKVAAPEAPAGVEISFEGPADPVEYGGFARLNWTVRGATDVSLDGNPVDPVGSFQVSGLLADETHTLEVLAADGARETREVLIQVLPESMSELPSSTPPPPRASTRTRRDPAEKKIPLPAPAPPKPAPPLALSFVPSTLSVPHGGDVELQWEAVNARSVTLDGKAVPNKGSQRMTGLRADRTFVLAAVGLDGNRDQRRLDIRVAKPGAPSIVAFAANPDSVLPGAPTTLRWQVEGDVSSISIRPGRAVSGASGTLEVKPTNTTEYMLTATGPGGTVAAEAIVRVRAPAPTVSFSANPPSVSCQGATQLTWSVQNATDVTIDPEPGRVAASGSERVSPGRDQTYTLTARGPGGVSYKEASVSVDYSGPSTGTILVKRRVQGGLSFEVPGFPCAPVDVSVVGDPLELVQAPTSRGGQWVAYFKSTRAGNRDIQSMIRWTVRP